MAQANGPDISEALKQQIIEEKLQEHHQAQAAQAYVDSLPNVKVSSAAVLPMTTTAPQLFSQPPSLDANLRMMVQHNQKKQQEMKVGKLSPSQQAEYQSGMEDQQKFHELLQEHMQKIATRKAYFTGVSHVMLSMLIAPLFTLSTSLQLSMAQNAVTIQEFKKTEQASRKFQARLAQSAGSAPERSVRFGFMELLRGGSSTETAAMRSARQQKVASIDFPFKAPVYRSYWEAINGIYKQGIRGFYKGNGIRSLHILLFHRMNSDATFWAQSAFPKQVKFIKSIPCFHEFLLTCSIDMLLQPLFVAESRFILQNRRPNFSVYKNSRDLWTKSLSELYRGCLMNVPRNFFIALTGARLTDQVTLYTYYGTALLFQTFSYPFLTMQKRLECRSAQSGLLPNDLYSGGRSRMLTCAKSMLQQEGPASFFKGYTAHTVALVLWMSVLPLATKFLMEQLPLYLDPSQMPQQPDPDQDTAGQGQEIQYKFDEEEDDDDF